MWALVRMADSDEHLVGGSASCNNGSDEQHVGRARRGLAEARFGRARRRLEGARVGRRDRRWADAGAVGGDGRRDLLQI